MKNPLTRLIYEDGTNFSPLISRDSYENEEENVLLNSSYVHLTEHFKHSFFLNSNFN